MKMRGRLKDIMQDVRNGGFDISFHVQAVPSGVETLREDTDLAITLAKWREQRSLSANAYYWVIIGKISEITGYSNAAVHNLLLRRYGVPENIDGELITTFIPDTDEAEKDVLEKEIYHLKPTSYTKEERHLPSLRPDEGIQRLRHEGDDQADRRCDRRSEGSRHRHRQHGRSEEDD